MLAYPSSQKPPWKSASRRAKQSCSHLQINLLVFLYSAPGYLRQSSYLIAVDSLLFLRFERIVRLLRPWESLLKASGVHFSTLCFGKKITNKQKTESYFWMQLCIWKDFKWSLFLSFSQSMTNSYSANLYFSNTVSTSLTLSALSKAAHRYSWCTEIS